MAQNSLCEENNYEAEGSQKIVKSNGPFKGRMNASCQVFYWELEIQRFTV